VTHFDKRLDTVVTNIIYAAADIHSMNVFLLKTTRSESPGTVVSLTSDSIS